MTAGVIAGEDMNVCIDINITYGLNQQMQVTNGVLVVQYEVMRTHLLFLSPFLFSQNIDCGYTQEPPHGAAVLMSILKICFGAKIRK